MKRKKLIKNIFIIIIVLVATIAVVITTNFYLTQKKERERLASEPYFTEYKISSSELNYMIHAYYVKTNPQLKSSWYANLDKSKWPDYSDFTIEITEETKKAVAVLNDVLFDEKSEFDKEGIKRAEEFGFSSQNPITEEWVIKHPKEAVYIISGTSSEGEWFEKYSNIEGRYNDILNR